VIDATRDDTGDGVYRRGSFLATCGLTAAALGHGTSFLVLTLAGAVAYVGVNVVARQARGS
jgi:hypothetical protein